MMTSRKLRNAGLMVVFLVIVVSGACRRQVPPPPPPPPPPAAPPPAARPTATLTAEPSSIQRGQSSTLRWAAENATEVALQPGIGTVPAQGTRSVSPAESTTYTLAVRGAGGTADATARITVTAPPPPPPPPPPPARPPEVSLRERFEREVRDAFFDYDKSEIRPDARDNLNRSAEFLRANSNISIRIEGHCDERGSVAYNLGLGDRRANATRDFLVSLGIAADRLAIISYGKERPFCTQSDETCWQQNRRGHLVCTNC